MKEKAGASFASVHYAQLEPTDDKVTTPITDDDVAAVVIGGGKPAEEEGTYTWQ